jgi:hypothetical protein
MLYRLPETQHNQFQQWFLTHGTAFLTLQNAKDVHHVSQVISESVASACSPSVFHHTFEFRHGDFQTDNVEAFLCTFLQESLWATPYQDYAKEELGWNLDDLFRLVHHIVSTTKGMEKVGWTASEAAAEVGTTVWVEEDESAAMRKGKDGIIWTLLNFDGNIKNSAWLLDRLSNLATTTDSKLRVIFISNSACDVKLDSELTTIIDLAEQEKRQCSKDVSGGVDSLPEVTNCTSQDENAGPLSESRNAEHQSKSKARASSVPDVERVVLEIIHKNPRLAVIGPDLLQIIRDIDMVGGQNRLMVDWLSNLPDAFQPTEVLKKYLIYRTGS